MTSVALDLVETKAARGVAWSMGVSVGSRVVAVAGTLILTYFLDRHVIGEVSNAAILVTSAVQVAMLGVPQFLVTRKTMDRSTAWHGTVLILGFSLLALIVVLLFAGPLCNLLKAPTMGRYLPGLTLSAFIVVATIVPERLAQRSLRFKQVSLVRGAREVSYTAGSVGLAAADLGGMAIVGGNIVRSLVHLTLICRATRPAEWLTPHRLRISTFRRILAFGFPVMLASSFGVAARSWDNLMMSGMYGAAAAGAYNLAYNLADIPAVQVGEQITDVLMPSLSQLEVDERRGTLLRATALVSLLVFPLGIGLGTVAPTLVDTLMRPEWRPVGPMLTVLSILAVVRPVGWTAATYLAASDRPRTVMWLSLLNVVALFAAMALLGLLWGPLWACAGVGVGFAVHAAASVFVVSHWHKVPMSGFARSMAGPLAACAAMVVGVLAARMGMNAVGMRVRGLNFAVEVLVGGLVYVAAAVSLARSSCLQLLSLVRRSHVLRRPLGA